MILFGIIRLVQFIKSIAVGQVSSALEQLELVTSLRNTDKIIISSIRPSTATQSNPCIACSGGAAAGRVPRWWLTKTETGEQKAFW